MTSVHSLKVFINERLTAAAEEIFTAVEQTIVQYEVEIHRQHSFLEITRKPLIRRHKSELAEHHGSQEKQLFEQVTNSCQDQGEPEPLQIKEEPEEPGLLQIRVEQEKPECTKIKQEQEEPPTPQFEFEEPGIIQKEERDILTFEGDTPSIEEQIYLSEPEEVSDTEQFFSCDSEVHLKKCIDSESAMNAEQKTMCIFHSDHVDSFLVSAKEADCEESCGKIVGIKCKIHESLGTATKNKRICEICGRSYNQKIDLLRHMRTHTGEKPYACEICGKRFSLQGNVLIHMRSHTGEKPYSCETCGKSFSVQSSLAAHMRTHTGEKPYSCQICGKSFRKQNALSSHLRTHTGEKPYSCQTCGKSFSVHSNLLVHKRTHTGEKPYSCEMCGKPFRERSGLRTHMRTHAPERPFSCETCVMRFTNRSSLLRHVKTHREVMKESIENLIQDVKI